MSETDEANHHEILMAASRRAQRQRAELLAAEIILAAEIEPDMIRNALRKVFDLSALMESGKRTALVYADIQRMSGEAMALLGEIVKQLDEIDGRIDGLHYRLDEAGKKFISLKKEVTIE